MKLRAIQVNEDRSDPIFSSTDCQSLLDSYEGFYPTVGYHLPWVGYMIIKENNVVGTCGFTGPPINNTVEVAYWTFQEYESQGVASFACKALIDMAKKHDPHVNITAKTAPEKNASTKILEKKWVCIHRNSAGS